MLRAILYHGMGQVYIKDNYSIFDMFSSGNAGKNGTSSRIYSYGETSAVDSGALTLSSGAISLKPATD